MESLVAVAMPAISYNMTGFFFKETSANLCSLGVCVIRVHWPVKKRKFSGYAAALDILGARPNLYNQIPFTKNCFRNQHF